MELGRLPCSQCPDCRKPPAWATCVRPCLPVDWPSAWCAAQLVPEAVVRAYARAMLNIHPALLPAFGGKGLYGARVHRAVIASGARWSGPSVHFVDADYDTGPILAQRVVPVLPTDTPARLAARVLAQARARRLGPRARCAPHIAAAGVMPGNPAGLPGAVPGAGPLEAVCAPFSHAITASAHSSASVAGPPELWSCMPLR